MKENWKKLLDFGLRTSRVFSENAMNVYSGYSAFYILMSLIPLIFLAVSAINLLSADYLSNFSELLAEIFLRTSGAAPTPSSSRFRRYPYCGRPHPASRLSSSV